MFEELPFMLGFIILSLVATIILLRVLPSPYNLIIFGFSIVGTVLHELCHAFMCAITRTPIGHISLLKKLPNPKNDRFAVGGEVQLKEEERLTFLKAFLIGLAPSYICFWGFWFLWYQVRYAGLNELTILLYILIMCSLVLGAAPSLEDIRSIGRAFMRDYYHSLYQLLLVGLSILSVWVILCNYNIPIWHEIVIYLFFAMGYAIYRYSFLGIHLIWQKFRYRTTPPISNKIKLNKIHRKTYKPMNPKRVGIEEPHW